MLDYRSRLAKVLLQKKYMVVQIYFNSTFIRAVTTLGAQDIDVASVLHCTSSVYNNEGVFPHSL